MIHVNGFIIDKLKMVKPSKEQMSKFPGSSSAADVDHMSSDVVIAMELIGDGAVNKWQSLMGAADPAQARSENPRSIRAVFGKDLIANAVYGSATAEAAAAEIEFFFGAGTT